MVVDEEALLMMKDDWVASEPIWFASPTYVESARPFPASRLFAYVTVAVVLKSPTPVTAAVHGSWYEPEYVTALGHVITVVDGAL